MSGISFGISLRLGISRPLAIISTIVTTIGAETIGRVGGVSSISIGGVGRVSSESKVAVEKSGISLGISLRLGISRPLAIISTIVTTIGTETIGRVSWVSSISIGGVSRVSSVSSVSKVAVEKS